LWNESFFSAPQLKRGPLGSGNMDENLGQRLKRFVRWGLYFAGCCSLFLIPFVLVSGNRPIPRYGITPLQIAAVYFATGIMGGVLVALAYPMNRWFLGAFALGTIAAAPAYTVFGLMMQNKDDPAALPWVLGGVCAVFVGGGVGSHFWSEQHGGASRSTVITLWVVVLLCQPIGWYLGLRWSGEPPATIGLGLVFLPLWVALLATISRNSLTT
jgi:hypothetical protein